MSRQITAVGQLARVNLLANPGYFVEVEILQLPAGGRCVGKVRHVFAEGGGELTGGDLLTKVGQPYSFYLTAVRDVQAV